MSRVASTALVSAAVLLLGIALLSGAWFSDDALRLSRIGLNWIHSGSPDFNPGRRILGFEQPLWLLLLTLAYALGGRVMATTIALQFLLFCGGVFLLWAIHRRTLRQGRTNAESLRGAAKIVVIGALLAGSNSFREWMASGLEYPLCFFLLALLAFLLARTETGLGTGLETGLETDPGRRIAAISLAGSLYVLTRFDLAWTIAPAALVLGWRGRTAILRHWRAAALGISPLALRLAFAAIHYGTVVPHRPPDELLQALPRADILRHGKLYVLEGLIEEPLTFLLVALAVAGGIRAWWLDRTGLLPLLLSFGALAYLTHVIWRGGDTVSGRMLCPAACVSAVALACGPAFSVRTYAFIAGYVIIFFDLGKLSVWKGEASRNARTVELFREWGIVDEFAGRLERRPSALAAFASVDSRDWGTNPAGRPDPGYPLLSATPGYDGIAAGPGRAVEDWRAMGPPRPELPGKVALAVRFKPEDVGTLEPVLSVGGPADGTQLMAEHLPGNGLRFQLRKSGAVFFSRAVPSFNSRIPHRLVVSYGSNAAGRERQGHFEVMMDGVLLQDRPGETRRYNFDEVVAGWNTQAYAGCAPRFLGEIGALEPATTGELERGAWPMSVADRSLIQLRVKFSRLVNSAEPIVATGTEGAGDIVFVRRDAPGRLVFGLDHWGRPPIYGPTVDIDDDREHRLQIALGPLFFHSNGFMPPDCVRVTMDGRKVLETRQELHPFKPTEVCVLDNPLAGSFCGRDFLGQPIEAGVESSDGHTRSLAKVLEENTGPVSLTLRFDGFIVRRGLGLVETGVAGAGDILYVVVEDRTRVRFYFDHWGVGEIAGPEVQIDPGKAYVLTVGMGSLAAPGATPSGRAAIVRATLDGRVVLLGNSPCHPAQKGQIHILDNALGSSAVSAGYDGTCLDIARGSARVSLSH